MIKSCRKTTSKRLTCSKRFKILKKVREHHRQIRRDKKKNPKKYRRKDPGIPNSIPFKEQLLKHVEETKKHNAEQRILMLQRATQIQRTTKPKEKKLFSKDHSFTKQFAKVLQQADVVCEVLDARDPLGSRCLEAEKEILAAGKKLVLIINKIDLIPSDALKQWLLYFRKWYTVMPFKANCQDQATNLSNIKGKIPKQGLVNMRQGLGVDGLMGLLANVCRGHTGKLTVGFIGIPNTGKSAIINTLTRRKAAPSSSVPGLTRECQTFNLDSKITLLDSPGIVLSKCEDPCEMALRNCKRPEDLTEPESAVLAILQRCPKRQIMVQYSIKDYASTTDFLCQLALRMGRLKKGGVADVKGAARILLSDWITGKLSHHTLPPESDAPIAEPVFPTTKAALDLVDFPLEEHDDKVFADMHRPQKTCRGFCPVAVVSPSTPFATIFSNPQSAADLEEQAALDDESENDYLSNSEDEGGQDESDQEDEEEGEEEEDEEEPMDADE